MVGSSSRWKSAGNGKVAAFGSSGKFHGLIENIGPRKPSVNEMVEESDDTLIHCQERGRQRWTENFRVLFSWPKATAYLPLMPTNKSMQMDANAPSEMEVIRELESLKRYKAGGTSGLLPFFFRDGGKVLTSELTKLVG